MKLFKESSILFVLFAAAFILFVLAPSPLAAASNDDYQISYNWTSGKNAETQVETFQPSNTSTLTYTISAKNSTSQIYFIAKVTNEGDEPKPGFNITGYPKTNLVSGTATVAEIKETSYDRNNGTLIIPLTNAADRFSIDLTIESEASTVYHDETNKITAGLYVKEDGEYISISNTAVSTANNQYPQLASTIQFSLLNPSLMPSGENQIDLRFNLMTGGNWNVLSNRGLRVMYDSFTINFSDVSITADGFKKNYSEWISGGSSPVQFETGTAAGYTLSEDGLSITFEPASANDYLLYNKRFEFSIHTTDDFKYNASTAPVINFTNLNISADMKLNDRGTSVQFTNIENTSVNNPAYLLPNSKTSPTLTGTQTDSLSATLAHSSASRWIISNSETYNPSDPFYYQELFKATFKNTVRDGTNETLTFSVPKGVTVTHIRAPQIMAERAMYNKISILKDGKTYELDSTVSQAYNLSELTATEDGTPLNPYVSGEAVVLKIDELLLIESATSSLYSYSAAYTITFIGTTAIEPNNYYFNVSRTDTPEVLLSNIQFKAVADYIISPGLKNTARYLTNSATSYTASPTLISRGDTFYMFNQFYAASYPYGSAVRVSPTNTTGLYSNPVIYFSVPPGLEIGDASITSSNGADIIASGAFKDYLGQALNITQKEIPNAGLYADEGGTLVEVKIHLNESGKEDEKFWIDSTLNCYARLPVTVSQEYTKNSFNLNRSSILISSWDLIANSSHSGGSAGADYLFTEDFNKAVAYSNKNGSYSSSLTNATVYVQNDSTVVSSVGVDIDSGYVYYNPSSEDSYPTLKAGSQNEMFKVYFYNGIGETVGGGSGTDPATLYFVLPAYDTVWRAALMETASLEIAESGNIEYQIYYSMNDFSSGIGSLTLEEVSEDDYWTAFEDIDDTDDIDWANVTAIKCEFYEAEDKSRFELFLPFELPPVDGDLVEYDQKAIGQTLYDVYVDGDSILSSVQGYTAAIMLSESDGPEILDHTSITSGESFVYKGGSLPEWYNISTRDDFTENVGIGKVTIVYRDKKGVNTTLFDGDASTLFNRSVLPASPGYAAGYEYTINESADNPVTDDLVGNYTINYTTTADDESKVAALSLNFQILKDPATIVLDTPAGREIFMNDAVPSPAANWGEYFRQFVSGNDTGVSILNDKFVYNESSALNPAVPGSYSAIYDYTDVGYNSKSSIVPVSVKYADELIVNAIAAGNPVTDLTVSIKSDGTAPTPVAYDNEKNGYNASIKAVKATPTKIGYAIEYTDVPAGLIDDTDGLNIGSATYAVDSSPIVHDLEFTPAKFTVSLDNASYIKNIILYQVGDSGDSPLETVTLSGDETSLTFDKEVGWFDDEEYYFAAELVRGYGSSPADDFNEAGSSFYVKTINMSFNHEDIDLSLTAEEIPFISGSVWNDSNGDSVMDDTEFGISSVTVNLLDSSFAVINSTLTADDGSYDFIEFGEKTAVYIQVNMPAGFNRVSAPGNNQRINGSNNYSSDLIDLTSVKHHADVNAGFYSVSTGGGGGTGGATVTDPAAPTTPVDGAETIDNAGYSVDSEDLAGYETPPEVVPKAWSWWWLWLLLLLLLVIAYYYYKKNKKNKKNM